ncbi:hypothetical protein QJS10_CPB19g00364 [Acorus calamus]|uniref:Reverse transcriptase domain-containing protein n=1 Tax=Acorus calamus TaxID=4465 RepID=A0AAV9CJ64_ACOCL|nr:hypothetical protein QJS10_CPB19g00364 [Acorus calamus]
MNADPGQSTPWLVGGDFNEVRYSDEKAGGRPPNIRRLHRFNLCLERCHLRDISVLEAYVRNLPESLSDHAALKLFATPPLLSYPKLFKFFNAWLAHDAFMSTLEGAWGIVIEGSAMFRLAKKLQHTMRILKRWNLEHFGLAQDRLQLAKEALCAFQASLHLNPLNPNLIAAESLARETYSRTLKLEEEVIRQKARLDWLQSGDRCTKFFYAQFAGRKANNTLRTVILPDDTELMEQWKVQNYTVDYFKSLLNKEAFSMIPPIQSSRRLSVEESESLCAPVSEEEILDTLRQMKSDGSPGPDGFTKSGKGRAAVKIDLCKAFGSIRWPFIQAILEAMGFNRQWIQWIESPRFSVLINGSPFGFFESSSGLRQGDPISPLLFVLGMEILLQRLDEALQRGSIGAFTKHSNAISHLLFADDLIIFSPINLISGRAIKRILSSFAEISGLELNIGKSVAFCGGRENLHQHFINEIGIPQGQLPVTYLGLPLFTGALTSGLCLPLIDKLRRRLQRWHGHLLSFAGRLELAKTVLSSLQLYWTSAFALPSSTIKAMEKVIRAFLWRGPTLKRSLHHVNWATVCLPKEEGGLGLKRIRDWSMAALGARFWEMAAGQSSLWANWMSIRYLLKKGIWTIKASHSGSWIWPKIIASRSWIKQHVRYIIYSGSQVQLWTDPWINGASLDDLLSPPTSIRSQPLIVASLLVNGIWTKPPWWEPGWDMVWAILVR